MLAVRGGVLRGVAVAAGPGGQVTFVTECDLVAVGEGGLETVDEIWHCVLALLAMVLRIGSRVLSGQAGRGRALATPE